jgi:hypothetical protein
MPDRPEAAAMYVSEFTEFLQDYKVKHPHVVDEQRKSRAIWWDKKPQSTQDREEIADSRLKQQGYVYQTKL